MTGFASYIFKFVLSVWLWTCLYHFVTVIAGYIFMLSIQRESGFIVIEAGQCPVIGGVAPAAISYSVYFILSGMVIFMAIAAGLRKPGEF